MAATNSLPDTKDILDHIIEEGLRSPKEPASPEAGHGQKQDASATPYPGGDTKYLSRTSINMIQEITKKQPVAFPRKLNSIKQAIDKESGLNISQTNKLRLARDKAEESFN